MRYASTVLVVALASCGADSDVSRELGAQCTSSTECDGRCLPPSDDYPDGFCTTVCNDSFECPGESACSQDEGGSCLFRCVDDAACAFLGPEWTCQERDLRGAGGGKAKLCRG